MKRARRMGVGNLLITADLAGRMNLLAVRKAIKRRVVAVLGEGVEGGVAPHRKRRKILADAFSVLLPLRLDGTPRLIRVFHQHEAHGLTGGI